MFPGERKETMNQKTNMKSLPKGELPDEKAERFGIGALSDAELLSVIIRTGCSGQTALETGYEILAHLNGIGGLLGIGIEQLSAVKGIGKVKAIKLAAIGELSSRIWKERSSFELTCSDSSSIYRHYREQMRHLEQEEVWLILLDNRLRKIKEVSVTKGTVNYALISPRDIFKLALSNKAVCFVLMHNHPSGDVTPSKEDRKLTETILNLGRMMELPMVDHIIFGESRYYSFRDACPELF